MTTTAPLEAIHTAGVPAGRVVDLSHVLLPREEQYTLEVSRRDERQGAEGDVMSTVYMWSHVGTHVEAPLHFLSDGGDAASLAIDRLMGPGDRARLPPQGRQRGDHARGAPAGGPDRGRRPRDHDDRPARAVPHAGLARPALHHRGRRAAGWSRTAGSMPRHRLVRLRGARRRRPLRQPPARQPGRDAGAGVPRPTCRDLRAQRVFLIALPWPVKGLDACPVRAIAIEPERADAR